MKKIFLIFPYILIVIITSINFYQNKIINNQKLLLSKYTAKDETLLSMMIENEDGEYKESEDNSWPGNDYILNKDRSGCENGGTLEYQGNNVYVKAASSDRCYVYFAIDNATNRCLLNYEESLACDLIKNKDNSLIYHDGKCDYEGEENCTLEAGDLSYRFVGANPNNYVCFGGDCSNDPNNAGYKYLYRIIGLFINNEGNYEAKLIKADAATKEDLGDATTPTKSAYVKDASPNVTYYKGKLDNYAEYYWNSTDSTHLTADNNTNTNMWKNSNLNTKNLNEKYYNGINPTYKIMIEKHEWQIGSGFSNSSYNAKLMYDAELGDNKLTSSNISCYDQGSPTVARQCNEINDLTYEDYVGLVHINDYMYGTLPNYWNTEAVNYTQDAVKNSDWLYLGIYEWTISRVSNNGNVVKILDRTGLASNSFFVYANYGARPVIYLSSDVKTIDGSGLETEPFKIGL